MQDEFDEQSLFARGPVVVFRWRNAEGWPVEYVSPNALQVFGHTAEAFVSGRVSYAELIHEDDLARVGREVDEAKKQVLESFEHEPYRVIHKDGSCRWFYDCTHLVFAGDEITHFLGYVVDITAQVEAENEKRALERQLLHSQKLESLGVLAGGVAHDFNNLLTGILGEASLARLELNSPHPDTRDRIEKIEQLTLRAAELTRQLLAYSGKGRFVVLPLDLSSLVEDMASMLSVVVSKKAVINLDVQKPLPAIMADRAQIQQIVMNLITNASEALEGDVGVITLKTATEQCSAETLVQAYGATGLSAGDYVILEVSDTGHGMSQEVQERLFDPFFTTKATGRGLGMSAILGIVRGHKGAIRVYSEPERGTSFKILLPQCEEQAVSVDQARDHQSYRGTGCVLVVDDDTSVRRVAVGMLEQLGFTTCVASNGVEALETLGQDDGAIILILLDMMMPVMNGKEALAALRRTHPDLPVLMSSGFNEQDTINRLSGRKLSGFLQKPYQFADMEAAVRSALS